MKRVFLAILLLIPTTAAAVEFYEGGQAFTHQGEVLVTVRHPGFDGAVPRVVGPHIEIECSAVHPVGTPDDARELASVLLDAADAAEVP